VIWGTRFQSHVGLLRHGAVKRRLQRKRLLTERYLADRHSYIENVRKLEGVDGAGFEDAYIRAERARIAFGRSRLNGTSISPNMDATTRIPIETETAAG
jgi:hypothetical protein